MWFSKKRPGPEPSFFAWSSEDYSVGVSIFDKEHEQLAALMNQIHASVIKHHDRDLALKLLESLIQLTHSHFDHEEGVMVNIDFHEREAHIAEHAALMREAKTMLRSVQTGGASALAIPTFLKTWLIHHMQTTDRKYSACMRRNGLH